MAVVVDAPRTSERLLLHAHRVARGPEANLVLDDARALQSRLERRAALENPGGDLGVRLRVQRVRLCGTAEDDVLGVWEPARPLRAQGLEAQAVSVESRGRGECGRDHRWRWLTSTPGSLDGSALEPLDRALDHLVASSGAVVGGDEMPADPKRVEEQAADLYVVLVAAEGAKERA